MPTKFMTGQDDLRIKMQSFLALLNGENGPDNPEILNARMHFARSFAAYSISERSAFLSTVESFDRSDSSVLLVCHDEMEAALRRDYSAHINIWTPAKILSDWTGYKMKVIELQAKLVGLMDWRRDALIARSAAQVRTTLLVDEFFHSAREAPTVPIGGQTASSVWPVRFRAGVSR